MILKSKLFTSAIVGMTSVFLFASIGLTNSITFEESIVGGPYTYGGYPDSGKQGFLIEYNFQNQLDNLQGVIIGNNDLIENSEMAYHHEIYNDGWSYESFGPFYEPALIAMTETKINDFMNSDLISGHRGISDTLRNQLESSSENNTKDWFLTYYSASDRWLDYVGDDDYFASLNDSLNNLNDINSFSDYESAFVWLADGYEYQYFPDEGSLYGVAEQLDSPYVGITQENDGESPAIKNGGSNIITGQVTHSSSTVPEPATIVLLALGIFGIAGVGRKKIFK